MIQPILKAIRGHEKHVPVNSTYRFIRPKTKSTTIVLLTSGENFSSKNPSWFVRVRTDSGGGDGLKGGVAQSAKRDLPAANDPVPDNEELRDISEEQLLAKAEDLREYSQVLVGEAQDLCRASRMLRRVNLFLAATNPAPDARNKQAWAEKLIEI